MKRIFACMGLAVLLTLVSCHDCNIKQEHVIANGVWNRFEAEQFEFDIDNIEKCYDIELKLAIDTSRYKGKDFPMVVKLMSADGECRAIRSSIMICDRDGVVHGERDGSGLIVCSQKIRNHFFFNSKGTYTMEVYQGTSKYDIVGIKSIALTIKTANLRYKDAD